MTGVGLEIQNPVIGTYTTQKVELDNAQRDLAQLQRTIAGMRSGTTNADALLFIPSIANGPQGDQLRQALQLLSQRKGSLRQLQLYYTDEAKQVRDAESDIRTLERERIPSLANEFAEIGRAHV